MTAKGTAAFAGRAPGNDAPRVRMLGIVIALFGCAALLLRNMIGVDPRVLELVAVPSIALGILLAAVAIGIERHGQRRQTGNY